MQAKFRCGRTVRLILINLFQITTLDFMNGNLNLFICTPQSRWADEALHLVVSWCSWIFFLGAHVNKTLVSMFTSSVLRRSNLTHVLLITVITTSIMQHYILMRDSVSFSSSDNTCLCTWGIYYLRSVFFFHFHQPLKKILAKYCTNIMQRQVVNYYYRSCFSLAPPQWAVNGL